MRILRVDPEKCTGDQVCINIAPDVFEMNSEGKAYVKDQVGADEETLQKAVKQCPSGAIYWEEAFDE